MRRALVTLGLLLLMPSTAQAHNVVSTSGIARVEPLIVAEVELIAAAFDFSPELRGSWQTLAVRGEVAIHERLSLSARVPWTYVRLADGRGALGLGDIEASAKAKVFATEHGGFMLSAGLGTGLPTGDPQVGIGSGHTEIAPFVAASTQPNSWLVLDAIVAQKWSVSGRDDAGEPLDDANEQHGSLVAPHADNETLAQVGVSTVWRSWYLRTSAIGVVAHRSEMDGLDAAVDLGFAVPGKFRISVGGSVPVAGSRRFDWQSRVAAALQFN